MEVSVIIPSINDPRLQDTLESLRVNGDHIKEIIVVLDESRCGLRDSVNKGMRAATGDYVLKVDDHCMFAPHFDSVLLETIEDNWIVVPRRYELDVRKWERMEEYTDYDKLGIAPDKIGGAKWRSRTKHRAHVLLDEVPVIQGSFYMMSRKHWDAIGGLQTEGYGQFANEGVELCLKTWRLGGKVMVNKNTWYAHKHRKFGRGYSPAGVKEGNLYSKEYWTQQPILQEVLQRFP